MQDADQIVAECSDLIAKHALDPGKAQRGGQGVAWRPTASPEARRAPGTARRGRGAVVAAWRRCRASQGPGPHGRQRPII